MKDLLHAYLESTVEVQAMLAQRTPDEIAYDSDVLSGLRKGWPIRKALKRAAEKHPRRRFSGRRTRSRASGSITNGCSDTRIS